VLPFSLPGGPIVLESFVGKLLKFEPGSTQEEVKSERSNQYLPIIDQTYKSGKL
jgi:hypothetical protein